MDPSTFVKLERNHKGIVIAVTRPSIGSLTHGEIVEELLKLDSAIQEGLANLESGASIATSEVPPKKKKVVKRVAKVEPEEEEEERPAKKKVAKKKKVTKKKAVKKTAPQEKLSEEQEQGIMEAVTNIMINTIHHDDELGPEGFDAMSTEEFDRRHLDYLNEILQGEELGGIGTKSADNLLKTLEQSEMYNSDFYQNGEFVEIDEEEYEEEEEEYEE